LKIIVESGLKRDFVKYFPYFYPVKIQTQNIIPTQINKQFTSDSGLEAKKQDD